MVKNKIRLFFPIEWSNKLDFLNMAQSQKVFLISSDFKTNGRVDKVEHNFRDLATFGLCTQGRRNRRVLETFGHDRSNNFLLKLFPIFGYSAGSTTDKGD